MAGVEAFFDGRSGIGVHQKRKIFELRNSYTLTDEDGAVAGRVEQARQSPLTFLVRLASSLDAALPVTLEVTDAAGAPVLLLEKGWFTTKIRASSPAGAEVGTIGRKIRIGKPVYVMTRGGAELGVIKAEDWRSRHFAILDGQEQEIGRVTKQWRGLLTEAFTDADSYAVEFAPGSSAGQRALALAGALAVDLIQKQKDSS